MVLERRAGEGDVNMSRRVRWARFRFDPSASSGGAKGVVGCRDSDAETLRVPLCCGVALCAVTRILYCRWLTHTVCLSEVRERSRRPHSVNGPRQLDPTIAGARR